jgi:ferredoxin
MTADTTIYYFTGTGNCLKVARDLAAELGDADLVSIPQVVADLPIRSPSACTGIVFPTYFGGLPLILRRFLQGLGADGYVFAVTTAGGAPGRSVIQARRVLARRGIRLDAGFAVNMPGNYTRLYGAESDRKQQKYFAAEAEKVPAMAGMIRERRSGPIEKSFFLLRGMFALMYRFYFSPRCRGQDAVFYADEKCNSCGVCAQVCPAGDIEMVGGRPAWQGRCEQCYACLQWCPQEAIQAGKKTPDRKRYRNPDIAVKDIIEANCRTARGPV